MAMLIMLRVLFKKDKIVGRTETFIDFPGFTAGTQPADIMDTRAERKSSLAKIVAPAARGVVLLQNQNRLPSPCQGKS